MVVLRRTQKLAKALPVSAPVSAQSDTALGDWYVNRVTVHRRPLLLLVSSNGLLPIVLPARDVASLPERLPDIVAARLRRLGVAANIVEAETTAMRPVSVGPTANRSVVGIMVDFAFLLSHYLERGASDEHSLEVAEAELVRNPCHASKRSELVVFPYVKAVELLSARWGVA